MANYNLAKEQSTGFKTIPTDRYTLVVKSAKSEPWVKNGVDGDHIEATCEIVEGEYKGRRVWDNFYIPAALFRVRQALEAGGSPEISNADISGDSLAASLIGLKYSAYIEATKTESGSDRYNVKEYKPLFVVAESEASSADFDRLMDGR